MDLDGQTPLLHGNTTTLASSCLCQSKQDHAICALNLCLSADINSAAKPCISVSCLSACSCEHVLCTLNVAFCLLPFRFERGQQKYAHVLDGDGYVCSFSFNKQGRVYFRSAYVRTRHVPNASTCCGLHATFSVNKHQLLLAC